MKISENYRYSINVNQWALVEYFKKSNISIVRQRDLLKKINGTHYLLLSFFIQCCTNDKLNKLDINGVVYTHIDDTLILENLPLVTDYLANKNTRVNKLKKWVKRLEDFGFIKRYTYKKSMRYIAIDEKLLYQCNRGDEPLSPFVFLKKYFKSALLKIQNEYIGKLPYNRYGRLKDVFFEKEHQNMRMSNEYYIDPSDLLYRFKSYLDECVEDPYYNKEA